MRSPSSPSIVRRAALLVGAVVLSTACSTIGGRPSPSAQPTATPRSASASPTLAIPATPNATAASATAVAIGTVYPETPNPYATPTPTQSMTPYPTPQPPGIANAIYAVIDQLGRPDWCDPDFYPLARDDELTLARQHLDEMKADDALYRTILDHNNIPPDKQLTDDQLLTVYRDWKVLTKAIVLTPAGNAYAFDYIALRGPEGQQTDYHVTGTVTTAGTVTTTTNDPTSAPPCPICLARGTNIDTPSGPVVVEQLLVGDVVWTLDVNGTRMAAPIVEVGSTPVPPTHRVVHLVLADGRAVDVSPGHPLYDGRLVGELVVADEVDGSTVVSADLVAYAGGATFDLLPAGASTDYWANGILLGSTL